jgi:hypothetical protein
MGWRGGAPAEVPLPADKLKCHLPPGGALLPNSLSASIACQDKPVLYLPVFRH